MSPFLTNKVDRTKKTDSLSATSDSDWLKGSFILNDKDVINAGPYAEFIRKNRYHSTADAKFTSTSPGMNIAVNPKPQFTRYCDPRRQGKLKNRPELISVETTGHPNGLGMGPFYSEAFDDNQQRIFMRFGTPAYTPLLLWISKAFDIDKAVLQNRGTITSTMIEAIGLVAKFFAIASAPLLAVGMYALNVIVQSSRFYSVKDNMYLYWATTENILNSLVARRTMLPQIFPDYSYKLDNPMGKQQTISSSYVAGLNALIPDVVDQETGRISVFALALRSQVAFNRMLKDDYDRSQQVNPSTNFEGYQLTEEGSHDNYFSNKKGQAGFFTRVFFDKAYNLLCKDNVDEKVETTPGSQPTQSSLISYNPIYTGEDGKPITLTQDPNDPKSTPTGAVTENIQKKKTTFEKYKEYMLAELSEGGAFAVFNVESTGSVGESFSSSMGPNPVEATFNAISSKARNIGNFLGAATDIPIVGDVVKFAADAGAKVLSESSFGLVDPVLALAYGVNVSMPKQWENSSATLPRASYKMKLISPYGNAYSQLFNIYLPLSMILAASLPRSTGNSTYISPFVCQVFDRGRTNIQLGMVDNVNITRGTSNLAFTRAGHPNAIDVDFSIANMDEIISVDVNSNGVISKAMDALNPDFSDNPFTSYMNTIAAVDVYTQVYRVPMIRLKLAERMMTIKSILNPDPAAMAAFTVNKLPFEGALKGVLGNNEKTLQDLFR